MRIRVAIHLVVFERLFEKTAPQVLLQLSSRNCNEIWSLFAKSRVAGSMYRLSLILVCALFTIDKHHIMDIHTI